MSFFSASDPAVSPRKESSTPSNITDGGSTQRVATSNPNTSSVLAMKQRIASTERRVARMEDASISRFEEMNEKSERAGVDDGDLDLEVELEQAQERWLDRIADFEKEKIDPGWAEGAREAFTADFSSVLDRYEGTVSAVDCRSEKCRLDFSFSSRVATRSGSMAALSRVNPDYNCAQHIWIDKDEKRSTVLIDCS